MMRPESRPLHTHTCQSAHCTCFFEYIRIVSFLKQKGRYEPIKQVLKGPIIWSLNVTTVLLETVPFHGQELHFHDHFGAADRDDHLGAKPRECTLCAKESQRVFGPGDRPMTP